MGPKCNPVGGEPHGCGLAATRLNIVLDDNADCRHVNYSTKLNQSSSRSSSCMISSRIRSNSCSSSIIISSNSSCNSSINSSSTSSKSINSSSR